MAAIRWISEAEADFDRACDMRDIVQAVQLIGRWVGKPIQEAEVERYDEKTGDPKATGEFEPYEAWNGVLWLGGIFNFPYIGEEAPLHLLFLETIREGETVQIGEYIVQHISERDEGGLGTMANQGGTVPAHIRIITPRRLA